MERLRYFCALLCFLASLGAAASDNCLGDSLSKLEKEEIRRVVDHLKCSWEPVHIKRVDVNGDGIPDYIVSKKRGSVVLIRKNAKLEMTHYIDFDMHADAFCPIRSGNICTPEIAQVPSILQPGYDVVVRSWQGCALIRGSDAQWKYDKRPWGHERFDCNKYDNREYLLAQANCVITGGRWGALNWGSWGSCWHPAADIGKPCKSSSDCQKLCIYEGPDVLPGAEVTGICSEYKHCRVDVINGRLGGYICVD